MADNVMVWASNLQSRDCTIDCRSF